MRKILTGLCLILLTITAYADKNYPTCVNSASVQDMGYIYSKIVLCPNGYIVASVKPRTDYHNFAIAYNNYCRDVKLTFSTNSANVLIEDWQYYQTSGTLPAYKPKGLMQIPNITTGRNNGVVKITNNSNTNVCLGEQCLHD